MSRLRYYFLTGLIVAGPLGITLYLTWSIITWVDDLVKPVLPVAYNPDIYFDTAIPGLGLLVALVGLTLLGFLTANFVGRSLIGLGEYALGRMPLVRNLYSALKQIFATVLTERGTSFQRAGLIEFPRPGVWAVVFISTSATGEIAERLGGDDDFVSVFLPPAPNPTSGFVLYVRRRDIIELDMTVEEAAKLVISAGMVMPPARPARAVDELPAAGMPRNAAG